MGSRRIANVLECISPLVFSLAFLVNDAWDHYLHIRGGVVVGSSISSIRKSKEARSTFLKLDSQWSEERERNK